MPTPDRQTHWQTVYTTKSETEVSWYEDNPAFSLALLAEAGLPPRHVRHRYRRRCLADALVASGQAHVTILDLSRRLSFPHSAG